MLEKLTGSFFLPLKSLVHLKYRVCCKFCSDILQQLLQAQISSSVLSKIKPICVVGSKKEACVHSV